MKSGHDPDPKLQAFRLLAALSAATLASALDEQLAQMLRAAFSDDDIDVSSDAALARAIEQVANEFRPETPAGGH